MYEYIINEKARIYIKKKENLVENKKNELKNILDLYIKNYPNYNIWQKNDFFEKENQVRTYFEKEDYKLGDINFGYIINNKELYLNDNFIHFIFLRYNGLQNCICNQELYLENNKDKNICKEQIFLDFYKKELEKVKELIREYENNKNNIKLNIETKIEFIKKICETINFGFEDINTGCDEVLKKKDLHPKTINPGKQNVLGSNNSDWVLYSSCNIYFDGIIISSTDHNITLNSCDKTVEWNILLNKYAKLASYYKKAPFIRFLINEGLIMPYRRFPSKLKDKELSIGKLIFGPYTFYIYDDEQVIETGRTIFKYFTFYDDTNHIIVPPLLRSSITITYTEFRDLLCYLNLPVFRSTKNKSMLFFPNYDMHQRLLEIQGLSRNYRTYTGRSIEWKWFKEDETDAKEAITCFCKEFEEGPRYGIEPVQYVWYEIMFENENTKKYIFLVCSWDEYMTYYSKSEFLIKKTTPDKLYVYNDVIRDHAVNKLKEKYEIERVDYGWFEITFDDHTTKKYWFIRCSYFEYLEYYKEKKLKYLMKHKDHSIYVYDYVINENDLKILDEKLGLFELTSRFLNKYLKYKKKYLELKNKYLFT